MNNQEKQRRLRDQIQTTSAMPQSSQDSDRVSISSKLLLILFGIFGLFLMNIGIWYSQIIIFTKFGITPFTFFETVIIYFTFVFTYWILTKPINSKD